MKNRVLIILALVVLCLPLLIGCENTENVASNPIIDDINRLKGKEPTWDSYGNRLTAVEQRPSSGGSVDTSGLTNKDNELQNQINQMKNKDDPASLQAQINALSSKISSNSTTTTQTSATGTVTCSMNPAAIQLWSTPYGVGVSGQQVNFMMHLVNTSSVAMYAKPTLTLSTNTQLTVKKIYISMNGNGYNMYSTGDDATWSSSLNGATATTDQIFSISGWNTSSSSLQIMPIKGFNNNAGEIYLNPGAMVDVQVNIANLLTDTNTGVYNISAIVIPHT